eukprot:TRINITY_DN2655_c0_g1_i1.p1 TRINITY_DN2655_c0_g1~~TRINITY_DN2655_c0_g1_i1.p1  ORF type:complete len:576 (-),score=165.20 TRINITY_DN2655_c0_g1_i1:100-1827(-)
MSDLLTQISPSKQEPTSLTLPDIAQIQDDPSFDYSDYVEENDEDFAQIAQQEVAQEDAQDVPNPDAEMIDSEKNLEEPANETEQDVVIDQEDTESAHDDQENNEDAEIQEEDQIVDSEMGYMDENADQDLIQEDATDAQSEDLANFENESSEIAQEVLVSQENPEREPESVLAEPQDQSTIPETDDQIQVGDESIGDGENKEDQIEQSAEQIQENDNTEKTDEENMEQIQDKNEKYAQENNTERDVADDPIEESAEQIQQDTEENDAAIQDGNDTDKIQKNSNQSPDQCLETPSGSNEETQTANQEEKSREISQTDEKQEQEEIEQRYEETEVDVNEIQQDDIQEDQNDTEGISSNENENTSSQIPPPDSFPSKKRKADAETSTETFPSDPEINPSKRLKSEQIPSPPADALQYLTIEYQGEAFDSSGLIGTTNPVHSRTNIEHLVSQMHELLGVDEGDKITLHFPELQLVFTPNSQISKNTTIEELYRYTLALSAKNNHDLDFYVVVTTEQTILSQLEFLSTLPKVERSLHDLSLEEEGYHIAENEDIVDMPSDETELSSGAPEWDQDQEVSVV